MPYKNTERQREYWRERSRKRRLDPAYMEECRQRARMSYYLNPAVKINRDAWVKKNKARLTLERKERRRNNPELIAKEKAAYKEWYRNRGGRESTLKRKTLLLFGLTKDECLNMLKAQEWSCAICDIHISMWPEEGEQKAFLDHDHSTNKVRGYLCSKCNTGLGMFLESQESLAAAIKYLSHHKMEAPCVSIPK